MADRTSAAPKPMTYAQSGVDYGGGVDDFKVEAQNAAQGTSGAIERLGLKVVEESRGESAFLIEFPSHYLAHVEEGLGTKNLIADAMWTGGKDEWWYDYIARDTVCMMLNDVCTLGALPLSVAMHLAVGSSDWFKDKRRYRTLIAGWASACHEAACTWGGGETPVLSGLVAPESFVISGSATGIAKPKSRRIRPENIRAGDSIVLVGSSGVHANGLTLCRKIAAKHPGKYSALLSDGTLYGETLLKPTILYSPLIERCFDAGIGIHYAIHMTGHGWRKLMRAPQSFRYFINEIPCPDPIFDFIRKEGPVDLKEMYGTYNMGAGFALYVRPQDVDGVVEAAHACDMTAHRAGEITKSDTKEVQIWARGWEGSITFKGDDLSIR